MYSFIHSHHLYMYTHTLIHFLFTQLSSHVRRNEVEHGIASLQNDMVQLNTLITEKREEDE